MPWPKQRGQLKKFGIEVLSSNDDQANQSSMTSHRRVESGHIYIYTHREREGEGEGGREREREKCPPDFVVFFCTMLGELNTSTMLEE